MIASGNLVGVFPDIPPPILDFKGFGKTPYCFSGCFLTLV
jgi:hypothetical protein